MKKPLDISQCEKEPVRFIGAIQPFGALVHLDKQLKVTHYSANLKELTGIEGESLKDKKFDSSLFPEKQFSLSFLPSSHGEIIEIEKLQDQKTYNINPQLDGLQKAKSLPDLLQTAANSLGDLTGLDRVMVYKFHEDNHGEVVAEFIRPGVDSFMGLHYPASDIPPQARAIFLENWVRMISDVHYTPVPLLGNGLDTLDLGRSLLRAVSPIHIEYLKNMKVGASFTVSIIVDGRLWGLFACHHNTPRYFPKALRDACETIGRLTSSLIRDSHLREIEFHGAKLRVIHNKLLSKIGLGTEDISKHLTETSPTLLDIIKSEGSAAALYMDGYWASIGTVPTKAQLESLVTWVSENHPEEIYLTSELSHVFPEAKAYKEIASGLLAASIPKTTRNYIFWFRPEIVQTVKWAGNPDKDLSTVNGRLSPRASFEEWKESVYGLSLPWQEWEIEAAIELRSAILALDLRRQFDKEQKARAQAERATVAREELMAVVSHDLKNPLSSIMMNAQLMKKFIANVDEKSKSVVERIYKSAATMNNLIEDILSVTKLEAGHVDLDLKPLQIHEVIDETIELLAPLAAEKGIKLERARHSVECMVESDHGRLLQVFSNIIGNAIKFTPDNGQVIVNIETCGPEFIRITVKDTGPGIPADHLPNVFDRFWQANQTKRMGTGLGLAIVKGIVEKHGGQIWAESELGKGSTFVIQLPWKLIENQ